MVDRKIKATLTVDREVIDQAIAEGKAFAERFIGGEEEQKAVMAKIMSDLRAAVRSAAHVEIQKES